MKPSSHKVLYVTQPTIGGAALHVLQLAMGLDPHVFAASIASPSDGRLRDRALASGIEHHTVGLAREISPRHDLRAFIELRALVARTRPDILHLHSSKAGFLGRLTGGLSRIPITIYTPHGFAFNQVHGLSRALYLGLERFAAPLADRIICVSPSEKAIALRSGVASDRRLAVIRNGVDPDAYLIHPTGKLRATLCMGKQALVVGMVARLARPKLPEDLLRAGALLASELPRDQLRVVFIGSGPLEGTSRRLAAGLGAEDVFVFLGDRDDVPELLPDLDVFVLATASEGAPYTILEAMASARPVVASRVGGVIDLVEEGSTGLMYSPGQPEDLAKAIRVLLGDEVLRHTLGTRARQRVEQEFSLKSMVNQTQDLYLTLSKEAHVP